MDYSDITKYIGMTVRLRYSRPIHSYKRQIDKTTGQEKYMDIIKSVPNVVTGIITACTFQTCLFMIMDDENDKEISIKTKDIRSVKIAKSIY
jgi:hypothetical protein